MPDPGTTPDIPPAASPNGSQLAIRKEVEHESFVETFTVRQKGRRYDVAANAVANKALMQINVAKLRVLAERAMKPFADNPDMPISPKELKILTEAFQVIDDMGARAYSDSKGGSGLGSALERLVMAAAKGGAAGAAAPNSHSPEARMKRLNSIGKKTPSAEQTLEAEVFEEKAG